MFYVLWWQICNFLLVSFVVIQRKFGLYNGQGHSRIQIGPYCRPMLVLSSFPDIIYYIFAAADIKTGTCEVLRKMRQPRLVRVLLRQRNDQVSS